MGNSYEASPGQEKTLPPIHSHSGEYDTLRVTSLDDRGRGTLREAAERCRGGRRVIFDTAGVIALDSAIAIRNPGIIIDGLTSPSPGITLRHFGLKIRTHHVRVSHVRIHVGDLNKEGHPRRGRHDGIDISGNNHGEPVDHIVIEHCSIYWATDEAASVWSDDCNSKVSNVLFRYCIFAESLHRSIHPKGPHSCGPLIGYNSRGITLYRNLIAHCAGRNPGIQGNTTTILANNIIYDPRHSFIHIHNLHNLSQPRSTIVGNLCIPGPSTLEGLKHSIKLTRLGRGAQIYARDNPCRLPGRRGESVIQHDLDSLDTVISPAPPLWEDFIVLLPSSQVEDTVLPLVGARPADRDNTDRRLIGQVRRRRGGIIDSPGQIP